MLWSCQLCNIAHDFWADPRTLLDLLTDEHRLCHPSYAESSVGGTWDRVIFSDISALCSK